MRDDLLDAYAAVDWARAHIPEVEKEFEAWMRAPPYLLIEEPHPEMGQKLFKLEINRRFPPTINAGVGAVINSVRSSLDLLAASLALRNGKAPNADRHFPICRTDLDFIDPVAVRERKKWLSDREISIIEGLKPYDEGDPLLFALHHLDVTRKHERLVSVHLVPTNVVVDPRAHAQGLRFPNIWPGFKDGAVIAWAPIAATGCKFRIPAEIQFNEGCLLANAWSVLRTCRLDHSAL